MEDDASINPEADSFRYMHMILEALNRLGHLDAAVDKMEQRLPVELFAIVDRTNQEVDLRHPLHLRGRHKPEQEFLDLDVEGSNSRDDVLNDLLWTLYSKFEAIAEGHRVVHDVVVGIAKREGFRDRNQLAGGFDEMWKLYQSEVSPFKRSENPPNLLRCGLCSMTTWPQIATCLVVQAGCRRQTPMCSTRIHETRIRHEGFLLASGFLLTLNSAYSD